MHPMDVLRSLVDHSVARAGYLADGLRRDETLCQYSLTRQNALADVGRVERRPLFSAER
jgi:hypothetical protein